MQKLLNRLYQGAVTVEFEKVDTKELRVMPCTLNSTLIPFGMTIKNQQPASETIAVWSIDKQAWRDIRVNTIKKWY